jgi:hypothetical protein
MKSIQSRQHSPPRSIAARFLARTGLFAIVGSLLLATVGNAVADEDGLYILQCFCPVEWSGSWDGAGIFNDDASLDTVALASDDGVLLIHEIPFLAGDLAGMIEVRGESLEDSSAIVELEETYADASAEDAFAGRSWENDDGETMLGFQQVQVWETNFLLSIEFVAAEDDFVEAWESLELVLLIGSPIFEEFDAEDTAELIAG